MAVGTGLVAGTGSDRNPPSPPGSSVPSARKKCIPHRRSEQLYRPTVQLVQVSSFSQISVGEWARVPSGAEDVHKHARDGAHA